MMESKENILLKLTFTALILCALSWDVMCQTNRCRPAIRDFSFQPKDSLFGIKLRPKAVELLAEVEKLAQTSINEFICADEGGEIVATSNIYEHGPYIMLSEKRGLNEDTIVHELFHLRLILKGFPSFEPWDRQAVVDTGVVDYPELICRYINNAIHHWIFYPEMRSFGLTPQDGYSKFPDRLRRFGFPYIVGPSLYREERILFLFRTSLEIPERDFLDAMITQYELNGWSEDVKTAQEMIEIVRRARFSKPTDMLRVGRKCLAKLNHKDFDLQIGDIASRKIGRFNKSVATIKAITKPAVR
jgi:hypothetical protein